MSVTPETQAPGEGRERPILFSGEMVRAILDGRKTQTRRVVKFPRPVLEIEGGVLLTAFDRMQDGYPDGTRAVFDFDGEPNSFSVRNPYGQSGDRLWVRETWADISGTRRIAAYRADPYEGNGDLAGMWKPSIHMPRWASRITLDVTEVRVERVQDITEDDARAEGIEFDGTWWRAGTHPIKGSLQCWPTAKRAYERLWNELNAKRGFGWDANPWVWVVSFPPAVIPHPSTEDSRR